MVGLPFDTTLAAGILGAAATLAAVFLTRLISGKPATVIIQTAEHVEKRYRLDALEPTLEALRETQYDFLGQKFSLHQVIKYALHHILGNYGPSDDDLDNEQRLYLILNEIPSVRGSRSGAIAHGAGQVLKLTVPLRAFWMAW
jgi:hypothetical protein